MSSSSTPARCARTPTTSSTATWRTSPRSRPPTRGCRSPSAAAWRRRTASTITTRAPYVDVVFGTHNIGSLPVLLERARVAGGGAGRDPRVPRRSSPPRCRPSASRRTPPGCRSRSGCNNTCTFCIVPALRGKEKDRRPGEILAEIEALVAEGVTEITLLGQNVNAYGVEFGDRQAFSKLLRACGEIEGLERVRFTSPAPGRVHRRRHRGDGRDAQRDAVAAHAAAVRLGHGAARRCAAPTGSRSTSASSSGSAPRSPTPRSPPTSSSASPARPRRTSGRPSTSSREARFAGGLHLPVLQAPRHPGRRPRRPGPAGGRQGPLPAPGRGRRRDRLGGEQGARRSHRRADGRRGRGPQGRRHPPALRPRARQPARPLRRRLRRRRGDSVRPGDMVTVEITYAAPHHLVADGADPVGPPHPRRRRLGASHVRPAGRVGRRPRHADRRRARPAAAGGQRLRLTPAG